MSNHYAIVQVCYGGIPGTYGLHVFGSSEERDVWVRSYNGQHLYLDLEGGNGPALHAWVASEEQVRRLLDEGTVIKIQWMGLTALDCPTTPWLREAIARDFAPLGHDGQYKLADAPFDPPVLV